MKELKNKFNAETLIIFNGKIPSLNIPKTFYFSVSDLKKNNYRWLI